MILVLGKSALSVPDTRFSRVPTFSKKEQFPFPPGSQVHGTTVCEGQGLGATAPQPVGLRVNWNKSKLSPVQAISFLGVREELAGVTLAAPFPLTRGYEHLFSSSSVPRTMNPGGILQAAPAVRLGGAVQFNLPFKVIPSTI